MVYWFGHTTPYNLSWWVVVFLSASLRFAPRSQASPSTSLFLFLFSLGFLGGFGDGLLGLTSRGEDALSP